MRTLLLAACLGALGLPSQPPKNVNMRTTAAVTGAKDLQNWQSEHPLFMTPTELFVGADTVVSGRVARVASRLADDAQIVITEYEIVPSRFLKRDPRLDSAARPAPTAAFLIRRVGGSVVEGDVTYSTWAMAFPSSEDLTVGEDVVLFLTYVKEEKAYYFADGPYGVFRVRSGQVVGMKRPDKTGGMPLGTLDEFLQSIQNPIGR